MRKALHAPLDDEGGDAARVRPGIGLGVDDEGLGHGTVGDPHFRAIDDVAVALAFRARRHRHDVGARVRLRHRQRPDMLAGNELGQIARLLRVIAVAHDLIDAEVRMGAVGQADRARGARDFLHRHAMLEIAKAQAAILLRRGDPMQAEFSHLWPEVARKLIVAVDLSGARRDLLLCEAAGAVADHRGALAEIEVEETGRVGDHDGSSGFRRRATEPWRQSPAFGKA